DGRIDEPVVLGPIPLRLIDRGQVEVSGGVGWHYFGGMVISGYRALIVLLLLIRETKIEVGDTQAWIELYGLLVFGDGLVGLLLHGEDGGKVKMGPGVIGRHPHRFAIFFFGGSIISQSCKGTGEREMSLRVLRV